MTPMKYISSIVALLLGGIGCVTDAQAYLLEEQQLFTKNKGCFINYLTEKNTNGWYIETGREECDKDGYLSGFHQITVNNAFGRPIEYLKGHFSNGYWTGETFLKGVRFQRISEEIGKQKATFDLYNDKQNGVRFIGQMTTQKTDDGTYPPFRVCGPLRIMGVVQDVKRLDEPQYLQIIFNLATKQIRRFCPMDEKAMLFLSHTDKPKQGEIAVFVQMDLKTRRHKIVRADELRASRPAENDLKNNKDVKDNKDKGDIKEMPPFVPPVRLEQISQENEEKQPEPEIEDISIGALNIDKVTLDDLSDEVLSDLTDEASKDEKVEAVGTEQENIKDDIPENKKMKDVSVEPVEAELAQPEKTKSEIKEEKKLLISKIQDNELIERDASREAASFFNTSAHPEVDDMHEAKVSQKSYLQPLKTRFSDKRLSASIADAGVVDVSKTKLPLAHVLLLSKVFNSPVLAQTAVHVDFFKMDGTGIVDLPMKLDVRDGHVTPGWHYIKGYFIAYKSPADNMSVGMIRLIDFSKCASPLCQEKK